jgi:ankyrin repeat protein
MAAIPPANHTDLSQNIAHQEGTPLENHQQLAVLFDCYNRKFQEAIFCAKRGLFEVANATMRELQRELPESKIVAKIASDITRIKRTMQATSVFTQQQQATCPHLPHKTEKAFANTLPPAKFPLTQTHTTPIDHAKATFVINNVPQTPQIKLKLQPAVTPASPETIMLSNNLFINQWESLLKVPRLVELKDEKGNTVLHKAISLLNSPECRKLLAIARVSSLINSQNQLDETPLHVAICEKGSAKKSKVNLLLSLNADPSIPDCYGKQPINDIYVSQRLLELKQQGAFQNVVPAHQTSSNSPSEYEKSPFDSSSVTQSTVDEKAVIREEKAPLQDTTDTFKDEDLWFNMNPQQSPLFMPPSPGFFDELHPL